VCVCVCVYVGVFELLFLHNWFDSDYILIIFPDTLKKFLIFFFLFLCKFFFFLDENLLKAYYMNYQHITYNCTRDTDRTDPFHHLYRPNIEISLTCTKDSNAQIDKN
jgi:hypothetical protein